MSRGPNEIGGERNTTHTQDRTSDRLAAQADGGTGEGARDAGKRPLHPRVRALIRRYGGKVQFGKTKR